MKYLVISKDNSAFWTNWFNYDKLWNKDVIRCVINIEENIITFNGFYWTQINYDHL